MAATKASSTVASAVALAAGAGDSTQGPVSLSTAYGAVAHLKLTNGATGPTVPAQIQIECSADGSRWFKLGGPFVGATTANAVVSWTVEVPSAVIQVRFLCGSNTAQAVTLDIDVASMTGI